jgi:guanylate kinase
MKRVFKDAVFIFILPPTLQILEKRLRARMSDDPIEIKKRIVTAKEELKHYKNYDFIVINDDLKSALKEMESIILSNRLKIAKVDSKLIKKLK